jgi:hypothetical protein
MHVWPLDDRSWRGGITRSKKWMVTAAHPLRTARFPPKLAPKPRERAAEPKAASRLGSAGVSDRIPGWRRVMARAELRRKRRGKPTARWSCCPCAPRTQRNTVAVRPHLLGVTCGPGGLERRRHVYSGPRSQVLSSSRGRGAVPLRQFRLGERIGAAPARRPLVVGPSRPQARCLTDCC